LKGKEYYKNGQLIFEGEYFDGRKWNGKGIDTTTIVIINI